MKPMPASYTQRPTCSGLRSIFTPRADNTSAAPERDESARLPCVTTGTPAPATMKEAQVDTLTEPEPSPPVPTTSTASAGATTRSIFERIAETAPFAAVRTRGLSDAILCRTERRGYRARGHAWRRGIALEARGDLDLRPRAGRFVRELAALFELLHHLGCLGAQPR